MLVQERRRQQARRRMCGGAWMVVTDSADICIIRLLHAMMARLIDCSFWCSGASASF